MRTDDLFRKVGAGEVLGTAECALLLSYPPHSKEALATMATAREVSAEVSDGHAEIHAQLALNLGPCPMNCSFCSFSRANGLFQEDKKLPVEQAVEYARLFEAEGANAVYVMTTAYYDLGEFVEVSREIRNNLKDETVMVANVGDKTKCEARRIREAGYQAVYHALRMREGSDTDIAPEQRLKSINNFKEAGLIVGSCVEPVGPEHSGEEIAGMIRKVSEFGPAFSGAARRITIPGSPLEKHGMISELRMAQIVAVTRLGTSREVTGNCTHEPCTLGALGGANLFWAEVGANPRDTRERTEEGRGSTVELCRGYFRETQWETLAGPSRFLANGGDAGLSDIVVRTCDHCKM
jgi:biotin synthase